MKHYPYVPGYPKPDYPDCMPESDCCGDKAHHCPPPPCPGMPGPGHCPPPPCPGMPGPGPGEFIPVPPPIEPLHPVPGCNTQEQMMRIVHKTNECINKWNYISSNCYAALNRVVGAAVSNDVYYDRDEVHLENGYSSNDECAYHIITIRSVDKCNQPIRIKLKTAYDNTTNANVRQSMQDVSFIENANAVITAVDPAQTGWKGTTFYCGAPIAGTQETDGYVGGFNDHGALKVFPASVDDLTLRQNCVVDIIGLVTPVITDGEITEQAKAMTTKASISAIGYRSGNGDKIFFQCSAEADKGMQGITVANILKDMGCTTAIITCAGVNSADVKFSNGMLYMGTLTDVPNGWLMPSNCAYWVVSKRPFDGWKNKFTAEIADLVQRVGGSYNEILNNKHRIEIVNKLAESNRDRLDDAEARLDTIENTLMIHGEKIDKLERDLAQEITDRKNEIQRVDGRIDQEVTDRTDADNALGARIDQEITDRTNADNALDEKITQETTERKAADDTLQSNIDKEAKARADADLAEQNERIHQDSLLHTEIDQERNARSDADADLASKIQKEANDRAAADTKLTNDLAAEATDRKDADVELTNEISAEATARKDADTALRNQIERLSTGQDIIPIYVKKSGDTMTGNLSMSGNSVVNVEGIGFNQGIHLDEADGRLNVMLGNDFKPMAGLDAVNDDEFVTKRQLLKEGGFKAFVFNDTTEIPVVKQYLNEMLQLAKANKPFVWVKNASADDIEVFYFDSYDTITLTSPTETAQVENVRLLSDKHEAVYSFLRGEPLGQRVVEQFYEAGKRKPLPAPAVQNSVAVKTKVYPSPVAVAGDDDQYPYYKIPALQFGDMLDDANAGYNVVMMLDWPEPNNLAYKLIAKVVSCTDSALLFKCEYILPGTGGSISVPYYTDATTIVTTEDPDPAGGYKEWTYAVLKSHVAHGTNSYTEFANISNYKYSSTVTEEDPLGTLRWTDTKAEEINSKLLAMIFNSFPELFVERGLRLSAGVIVPENPTIMEYNLADGTEHPWVPVWNIRTAVV